MEQASKDSGKPVVIQVDQWADASMLAKIVAQAEKSPARYLLPPVNPEHEEKTGTGTENTEINVSPLIDLVFILLIFFIVATSFVNEVGITPKHKDTASSSSTWRNLWLLTFPVPVSCCRTACQLG